jgi:hypothetical protein
MVYKAAEIYRLRGVYWNRYYHFRVYARNLEMESARVLNALVQAGMPEPEIQLDGSIYYHGDVIRASHAALDALGWVKGIAVDSEVCITWLDLMCPYFWSESGWMNYVRLYEALPDPVGDCYITYERELDGGKLVPMASKSKRGKVVKPVDKPVDNPVDKSGTSKEQVPASRYNSGVSVKVGG